MLSSSLRIDADRLWQSTTVSASIGTRGEGLGRLSLTDADAAMRRRFIEWCEAADLDVAIDGFGNIFARREGTDSTLPAIAFGSHLDTQAEGGRFDGVLGVLAGLEVIRTLNDHGHRTRHPLLLINWTNEEGARFSPPMLGSGCFTGSLDRDWTYAIRANDTGNTFRAELERTGFLGTDTIAPDAIGCYLELHIEQGPNLEAANQQIGVVTHGASVHGFRYAFTGETAHAGTQPMSKRRNALVAAARLATAIDEIGHAHAGQGGMATTARIAASPNRPGILSNQAELAGDIRHPDAVTSDWMWDEVRAAAASAAEATRCDVALEETWEWGGDIFDAELVKTIRSLTERLGYRHQDIASQAGHDAYFMAQRYPTAMIFVPCADGITHHPGERIGIDDSAAGANVLLHAVVALADREDVTNDGQ
jgi:N-carbamoyl-L-amino-acid hydrolase